MTTLIPRASSGLCRIHGVVLCLFVALAPAGCGDDSGAGGATGSAAGGSAAPSGGTATPGTDGTSATAGADGPAGSPVLEKVSGAWFPAVTDDRLVNGVTVEGAPVDGPIIVVLVDTLRPDRLKAYNTDAAADCPFSDRLAAEGLTFTNAFSDAPWTRPSTASIFTGLYPTTHGADQRWATLSDEHATLAEHLRKLGFATGAVIANINVSEKFGFGQGFIHYADRTKMGWGTPPRASVAIDAAMEWLETRSDPRFYFYLHIIDPHDPYAAPGDWDTRYVPAGLEKVEPVRKPPWEGEPFSDDVKARTLAAYDGEIGYYENELLRITTWLEEKGWYDRATIIFTSDHGEAFGEHNVFRHAYHMWDEVLRVPLIVKTPRMSHLAGKMFPGLVQGVDILPSVVELAGEEAPIKIDGRSWIGRAAGVLDTVVAEVDVYGISGRSVRGPEGVLTHIYPVNMPVFDKEAKGRAASPSANFTSETATRWHAWPDDPFQITDLDPGTITIGTRLLEAMDRREKGLAPKRMAINPEDLDADELKHMKALGYMD